MHSVLDKVSFCDTNLTRPNFGNVPWSRDLYFPRKGAEKKKKTLSTGFENMLKVKHTFSKPTSSSTESTMYFCYFAILRDTHEL